MKSSRELGVPAIPPAKVEANTTYARRTKAKAKHHGHQQLRPRVGIKSPPRQIPTAGETGWRWPRQDHQMAKSSWPQGRNWGLYHRSPRSKPPSQLVPTQHSLEAWRGLKTMWPFRRAIDILVSAVLNWLKLNTPTTTKRQLHTCIGRSSKSLALRWRT